MYLVCGLYVLSVLRCSVVVCAAVVWCGPCMYYCVRCTRVACCVHHVRTRVQAQAESDKLRAVVIPLEEEIASLKGKLQEAEETIKAFELAGSSSLAPLIDLTGDDEGAKSPVDGEKEIEKQPGVDGEDVSIQQQQGESPLGMTAGVAAKSRKLKVRDRIMTSNFENALSG